jgi:hypothetical protein
MMPPQTKAFMVAMTFQSNAYVATDSPMLKREPPVFLDGGVPKGRNLLGQLRNDNDARVR